MDYSIETLPLNKPQSDCLIIGIYENQDVVAPEHTPDTLKPLINAALNSERFSGKNSETLLISLPTDSKLEHYLLVGLGEHEDLCRQLFRKSLAAAIKAIKNNKFSSLTSLLTEAHVTDADTQWKIRQTVEVFSDNIYKYSLNPPEETPPLQQVGIAVSAHQLDSAQQGLLQGLAIAEGMNRSKRLGDLPGNICTPSFMAEQAAEIAQAHANLSLEILEEADMEELGMGSFLAVSRGSRQPAKLINLNYQGGNSEQKPIVLIGKGLTFDAGGISLKPGAGMDEMKYDMCGGATVLGVMQAVAQLQLPINVIGLVPSSENLPDGDANKPGDVLTSMSGLTIEVLNTDAEGRLILCDTLTYAKRFEPEVVIDMATLTGACLVALGRVPSGLLGNNDKLCDDLLNAAETSCDKLWRLPLWEEYQEQLKSNFADMANIGGKDAGTITAACFLSRFAEDFDWAHLDIAGTAWRTGQNKGATGRPVPLLMQYLFDRVNH